MSGEGRVQSPPKAVRPEEAMAERFAKDTEGFTMTVAHDAGAYKHLRFRGERSFYWYDLIAWPGTLTIRGDMGTFVFARNDDMLAFFRGQHVNPSYWAEKEQTRTPTQHFDHEKAERTLRAHVADARDEYTDEGYATLVDAVDRCVEDEDWVYEEGCRRLLDTFHVKVDDGSHFALSDTWEWNLSEWSEQYLWCITAIVEGIRRYDAAKGDSGQPVIAPARVLPTTPKDADD